MSEYKPPSERTTHHRESELSKWELDWKGKESHERKGGVVKENEWGQWEKVVCKGERRISNTLDLGNENSFQNGVNSNSLKMLHPNSLTNYTII